MHPIEHLRYVARSRGANASELVREAAIAIGSMHGDHRDLVIACRRIVERHPEAGPLWWLGAELLVADDPHRSAWDLAERVADDRSPRAIAAALPDDATVLTIGWPTVAGAALARRGDVRVLCADARHEASSFMQRLERSDVECEPVEAEALARATAAADLVIVDAVAACAERVLAPIGSHVVAAVAKSLDVPVWCAVGIGRRLPVQYVDEIASRVLAGADPWDLDVDDLPVTLITHVASIDGLATDLAAALRPDCAFAPELLRTSAM
jgi:hypothetical protein